MRKEFKLRRYWTDYRIKLKIGAYENGNLAIYMFRWDKKEKCWLPWEQLTANLEETCEKNHAFVDTNYNGEEIQTWILRYGLAMPTGKTGECGLCTYPEYRFRENVLRKLDREGYGEYLAGLEKREAGKGRSEDRQSA